MKTRTLSVLAVLALLSVNLVSGSVIKKGLDNNGLAKKNLVEAGVEDRLEMVGTASITAGDDCPDVDFPSGLPLP